MNIYPAIDLKNNQVVRLYQGDFNQMTTYAQDPIAIAKQLEGQGMRHLHIIDLDGASNKVCQHLDIIKKIATQTQLIIQTGGGIRQQQQLDELFLAGIDSVIIGSLAMTNPSLVEKWLKIYGANKIVIALDIKLNQHNQPEVLIQGWLENSKQLLWDRVTLLKEMGARKFLCTDIDRDGTLHGPNYKLYQQAVSYFPNIQWQASGGIRSDQDLQKLDNLGLSVAIVGKAFYEKKFF